MKNILHSFLFFLLLLLSHNHLLGQKVAFDWVAIAGSTSNGYGMDVVTDKNGNIYVTGYFRGPTDFDPSLGVNNIIPLGGEDLFIQKLDPKGNLIWIQNLSDVFSGGVPRGITIDDQENIIIVGEYHGTGDWDFSSGVSILTHYGGRDVIIVKLDKNGQFLWANNINGRFEDLAYDVDTDSAGNIYLSGVFSDEIRGITSNGQYDVFIQKFFSNGNRSWLRTVGGTSEDKSYSVSVASDGNILVVGDYGLIVDFDPGPGVTNLTATDVCGDIFIQKLDASTGFLIWVKEISGGAYDICSAMVTDSIGNIYMTGYFQDSTDFDPGLGTTILTASPSSNLYILKLDPNANLIWAKSISGSLVLGDGISVDKEGSVYTTGKFFQQNVDFDPGSGVYLLSSTSGSYDPFIQKLDVSGNFVWAKSFGGVGHDYVQDLATDDYGNVYITGYFVDTVDFDPELTSLKIPSQGLNDIYVYKLRQKGVSGKVYQDINQNCIQDSNELVLKNRLLTIQPGNILVQTNYCGVWSLDSLPAGNYTLTVDTTGNWIGTCPVSQNFTVVHPDSLTIAPYSGLFSTMPCPAHGISVHAPFLRPGFSNQKVFVQVCNQNVGTDKIDSAVVIVQLDDLIKVDSASINYTTLGNNIFSVATGNLYPGECKGFYFYTSLDSTVRLGRTLCIKAELSPTAPCIFDSIPSPYPLSFSQCNSPYDQSHLEVQGLCENDTIKFAVTNSGLGNMDCWAPVRVFVDGTFLFLDSVQLNSNDTTLFSYSGDGRTWRLEVDQHPLHPGNSNPSSSIELCGPDSNWTSNLVNIFPVDDADPNIDIYCGLVSGSYDPNDKIGFPLGVGATHNIKENQVMEYLIRFQNTGSDTAFTVVIRDTLSTDLDIFSVHSGTASHDYSFRIYGQRVLEWTFYNIKLTDTITNEPGSHGFIKFNVQQQPNLPIGTIINNSASIYFDFNPPIFTSTTFHQISAPQSINWSGLSTFSQTACEGLSYNGFDYYETGTYYQAINNGNLDSLYTLNFTITKNSFDTLSEIACNSYIAPDAQVYTSNGQYTAIIPNSAGCDSSITVNLTIIDSSSQVINETICNSYTAPDAQIYTTSGQYSAILPNAVGCDSIISINLTILDSTSNTIYQGACFNYTAPDAQVYTTSGLYTAIIPNVGGCDSTISINLIIFDSTSSTINETSCFTYTAPDAQVYTNSGLYTAIIPNVGGCDSTISINLAIDSIPTNAVAQNGFTLTADATNLAYQWVDCGNANAPILGAINQTFTPIGNGDYAVEITNGTCTVTSNCINITGVRTSGLENDFGIHVYPNPTDSKVYLNKEIEGSIHLKLIDNLGRELISKTTNETITILDLSNYAAAVYYLSIRTMDDVRIIKVIKK
jgi:uncharacterized repeat protein (TIGR01451 family)